MKDVTSSLAGIVAIVILAALILAIAPMLFLWTVNSLADAGGADFYIPHSFWTYLYAWVFLALIQASATAASK